MNEMLRDARKTISSPEELARKERHIKAEQLLGLEVLANIYMLAVLNMILMGDGSSNIINKDSLKDFNGKYGYGKTDVYKRQVLVSVTVCVLALSLMPTMRRSLPSYVRWASYLALRTSTACRSSSRVLVTCLCSASRRIWTCS